jgi:hypothetical protein
MIWTKIMAIFTRVDEDLVIDTIPLPEISQVTIQDVWHAKTTSTAPKSEAEATSVSSLNTNIALLKSAAFMGTKLKINRISADSQIEAVVGNENDPPSAEDGAKPIQPVNPDVPEGQSKDPAGGKASSAVLQIQTTLLGFNSGRTYYIRIPSVERCQDLLESLNKAVNMARAAYDSKSRFQKSQDFMRDVYNSRLFQYCAAFLIFAVSVCLPNSF